MVVVLVVVVRRQREYTQDAFSLSLVGLLSTPVNIIAWIVMIFLSEH